MHLVVDPHNRHDLARLAPAGANGPATADPSISLTTDRSGQPARTIPEAGLPPLVEHPGDRRHPIPIGAVRAEADELVVRLPADEVGAERLLTEHRRG
jgi:hypothetical protein